MVVWSIPALVVMFLGGIAWIGAHSLDPTAADRLASQADRRRGRVARLEMAVHLPGAGHRQRQPARRPGRHADPLPADLGTVMNSFFVPQLGSQIYTMAAMTTRLNLQADRPGRFPASRRNSAATASPDMRFIVDAVDRAAIPRLGSPGAQARASARRGRLCRALARPGVVAQPLTFGAVAPGLFDRIAADPDGSAADPAGSAAAHGGH